MKAVGIVATSTTLVLGAWWFTWSPVSPVLVYEAAQHSELEAPLTIATESVFFVGDIMLARDVEKRLMERSIGYAFKELSFLQSAAAVFGNFEAAVPAIHEPTPNMVMKFSVPVSLLPILKAGRITHLSLANNHALDYGELGYDNTRRELESVGIQTFGHPVRVNDSSVNYFEAGGKKLAVIGLNATFGDVSKIWMEKVSNASSQSDIQIIFIHWGTEYESVHNDSEESLAHLLIDAGADLVIGHHPHVVQDIEKYGNGLIFYSLGNLLFDQYWNNEVQEGLVVELVLSTDESYLTLHPVESHTTKMQPRPLSVEARTEFLNGLAARSSKTLTKEIANGRISLQF